MYIPEIIILLIAGIVYYFWSKSHDDSAQKYRNEIDSLKQKSKEETIKFQEEEVLYKKKIISATFDCSESKAEEIYTTLENTYNLNDFFNAKNNTFRKEIYNKALAEEKSINDFHIIASTKLLPLCQQKGYDIPLEIIENYRDEFYTKLDISEAEKAEQICLKYVKNEKKNHSLLNQLLPANITSKYSFSTDERTDELDYTDVLAIANIYNDYFGLNLSDTTLSSIDFEELSDATLGSNLSKNYDSLFLIFCACAYNSDLVHPSLKRTLHFAYFYFTLIDLFIFIPYYDLNDFKIIFSNKFKSCLGKGLYNTLDWFLCSVIEKYLELVESYVDGYATKKQLSNLERLAHSDLHWLYETGYLDLDEYTEKLNELDEDLKELNSFID